MVLKGLPESFKPFDIFATQSDETLMFADFKMKLRSYENTENMRKAAADDNVMGARAQLRKPALTNASEWGTESMDIVGFQCGQKGHKARVCQRDQQGYSQDMSSSRRRRAWGVWGGHLRITRRGLMVDTGATLHIITDLPKFKRFDEQVYSEQEQEAWCKSQISFRAGTQTWQAL